jgi:DNA-binding XRE family transcriptional regulator
VQSPKCLLTATRFNESLLLGRVNSCHGFHERIVIHASGFYRGKSGSSVNVRFGKRLGALRKDRGWTYTYLSEHSGVATTFLHGLEHGTKEPCLNTIDILAKSFELSISELMRGV